MISRLALLGVFCALVMWTSPELAVEAEPAISGPMVVAPGNRTVRGVVEISGPESRGLGQACFFKVQNLPDKTPFQMFMVPEAGEFLSLTDNNGQPVGVFSVDQPGQYSCIVTYFIDGQMDRAIHTVQIGGVIPVPPVPPGPNPPVPPDPTPQPGKRSILIVYESQDKDMHAGKLITALRTGTAAKYLIDKGHSLAILDDDSVGPDGKPSARLEQWRKEFAGMKLPALFIIDPAANTLIKKQEIGSDATADNIIETIRQSGG